ncbi:hypothetical protein [Kitasatospora sp. NPDC098663]|uniref:hypothetical protein n=1 Tax=Kitasatospora sp. NPDC098663 TaxID=3364096 RepID=UPI00380EE8B0
MIIELPLGGTRHGSYGRPVDLGNERFLRAVVGGDFRIDHRSVEALAELPRPTPPDPESAEPEPGLRSAPVPGLLPEPRGPGRGLVLGRSGGGVGRAAVH